MPLIVYKLKYMLDLAALLDSSTLCNFDWIGHCIDNLVSHYSKYGSARSLVCVCE